MANPCLQPALSQFRGYPDGVLETYTYQYRASNNVIHSFLDPTNSAPIISNLNYGSESNYVNKNISLSSNYPPMSIQYTMFQYSAPMVNYSNIFLNNVPASQNPNPNTNLVIKQAIDNRDLKIRNVNFSIGTLGTGSNVLAYANYSAYSKRVEVYNSVTNTVLTTLISNPGTVSVTDTAATMTNNTSLRIVHNVNTPTEAVYHTMFLPEVPRFVYSVRGNGGNSGTVSGIGITFRPTDLSYPFVVITY